jgi:hypothetical protein
LPVQCQLPVIQLIFSISGAGFGIAIADPSAFFLAAWADTVAARPHTNERQAAKTSDLLMAPPL